MAAISWRRSAGVRSASAFGKPSADKSVVVCMGMLPSGLAHDDLGFASGASSGWNGISLLFTYPVEVRNVELGSKTNAVVNPEGVVQQRIREFWRRFSGCGSNLGGCVRTPVALSRTRERRAGGGKARSPLTAARYGKTPKALALGVLR